MRRPTTYFQAQVYRLLPADADPDTADPSTGIPLSSVGLNSEILVPDDGDSIACGPLDDPRLRLRR